MKTIHVLLLVLAITLFSSPVMAENSTRIITITSGEYPPFTGKYLPHEGASSHIITEAFKLHNIQVRFVYFPNEESLYVCRKGRFVATTLWICTPDRKEDFYCSYEALAVSDDYFFHLKTLDLKWNELVDLKPYRIGAVIEYDYGDGLNYLLNEKNFFKSVIYTTDDILTLKKMLAGEVDVSSIAKPVGLSYIRKLKAEHLITYHPKVISTDYEHVLFSKAHPDGFEMCKKFDEGYRVLKERGFIEEVNRGMLRGKYDGK